MCVRSAAAIVNICQDFLSLSAAAADAAAAAAQPFVLPLKSVGHNEGANAALLDKHTDDDDDDDDDGVDDRRGAGERGAEALTHFAECWLDLPRGTIADDLDSGLMPAVSEL